MIARLRLVLLVLVIALTMAIIYVQAFVLRPRLWPAGAGLVLSGDAVMGALAEPAAFGVPRLPDIRSVVGQPVVVSRVWPGGAAERAGLTVGTLVTAVEDSTGHRVALGERLPAHPGWRARHLAADERARGDGSA